MATAILRPESGGTHTWSLGTNPDDVDDEVEDPTAGDGLFIGATYINGDDDDVEVFVFPTFTVDSITNITVKTAIGADEPTGQGPEIAINMGGWTGYTFWGTNEPAYVWWTKSYDGSWSQSDLDGLQVRYRANVTDPGKGISQIGLDVVYVIVTYTIVSGWGHNFNGVPNINIAKINGVAKANIARVNGV